MSAALSFLKERLDVATSWRSLVRIHVWILLGLVVTSAVIPAPPIDQAESSYNQLIASPASRELGLDRGDDRGFYRSPDSDTFKISWTGGSSLQSIGEGYYEFIPSLTRDLMPAVDGSPTDLDLYFLSGIRLFDEYVAVLEAIDRGTDLLVITINPVWVLNDRAIQGWPNLGPTAARQMSTSPRAWPLAAMMVPPDDWLIGLGADRIGVVNDRWTYGAEVRERLADWTPLDRTPAEPDPDEVLAEREPTELQRIAAMQIPIQFWSEQQPGVPGATLAERQLAFLEQSDLNGGTWNDMILKLMGAAVRDSGIPTFVYVAPVDPSALANPDVDAALTSIEDRLADFAVEFDAPHVHFDPNSLDDRIPEIPFNDLVHIGQAEPLAEYLSAELCAFLTELGHTPDCVRPPALEGEET